MAFDKIVDSEVLDAGLTSIAEAIRSKSGSTEGMVFPDGFVEAVNGMTMQDTASIDLSGWTSGVFVENYVDGTSVNRTITFDSIGRPTSIVNPNGSGVIINW